MSHSQNQNENLPFQGESLHVFVQQQIEQQIVQQDNRQYHVTINNLQTNDDVRSGSKENTKTGIEKLQKVTRKLYHSKYDVDLANFDVSSEAFPAVYSEMFQVDFYQGRFIPNDDKYNPANQGIKITTADRAVTIDHLVSDVQQSSFVSVIGYPGAGKTTLSKRLARRLSESEDFLVLRMLFMNMSNSDNKRLTLKEFLLEDCNYNLNEDEKNSIFEWIKTNPEYFFIILDGFDQVSWNLDVNLPKSDYDTSLNYQELLSNLCLAKFLQNCHLIFTSRPHAMLKIPQRCQPKRTYFIHDLTSENMKKLFDALINDRQQSEVLWKELAIKTPHLKSMCYNPLTLQLYLRASLSSSREIANISTMTRVFHTVLLNLKASEHAISLSDEIVTKLSKIAYEATDRETVLITTEDLVKENLSVQEVQDIVVTLLGANKECGLLEGKQRLYFSHQTFQEYFTALYICREMPLESFASFVKNNLLGGHWSVVVQFLSGLLLDPYMKPDHSTPNVSQQPSNASTSTLIPPFQQQASSSSQNSSFTFQLQTLKYNLRFAMKKMFQSRPTDEKLQKKKIFISELNQNIREIAAKYSMDRRTIFICKLLRESSDDEVIKSTGKCFHGCYIEMESSHTQNDFHAVASVLKSTPAQIGRLSLRGCNMTSKEFLPWVKAINLMPGSLVLLDIGQNYISNVDDVITILHKVDKQLEMQNCLDYGNGQRRHANMEERARLQKALNEINNKKLKILVSGGRFNPTYITHKN